MAQKNNIRSIRFSDEMADLIDRQVGSTFTEKFENLVTRCVWELPTKAVELKQIQEQIDQERQKLYDLQQAAGKLRALENDLKQVRKSLVIVGRRAKKIAEKFKDEEA